jgi:nitrogen fixation/metabolism regulation signal transduction histidine kinase
MQLSRIRRFIVIQGLIVLLLVITAFFTATNLNRSLALTIELTDLQEGVQAVENISDALEDERIAIGQYPLTGNADRLTDITEAQVIYDENWTVVQRVFGGDQAQLLTDIETNRELYVGMIEGIVEEYQSSPVNNNAARLLSEAINFFFQNIDPKLSDLSEPALVKLVSQVELERARANNLSLFSQLALGLSIIVGIVVIVLVVVVLIFSRRMIRSIQDIVNAANAISRGDMNVPIDVEQGGDIGELAQAIERMRTSLRAAIERLRR